MTNFFKNIILFLLFILFAKATIYRLKLRQGEKTSATQISPKHKFDKDFLESLIKIRKNAHRAIKIAKNNKISEQINKLEEIINEIENIEEKYNKKSHLNFLLGPIGAMATALKEKKLAQNLAIANKKIEKEIAPSNRWIQ
jgi:hypothetical protein